MATCFDTVGTLFPEHHLVDDLLCERCGVQVTAAHLTYNRKSRALWITDDRGATIYGPVVAPAGEPMFQVAGQHLSQFGLLRTGDFMLVSDGSPLRRCTVALPAQE